MERRERIQTARAAAQSSPDDPRGRFLASNIFQAPAKRSATLRG